MAITNGFFPRRKPTDLEFKRATIANAIGTGTYTIGIGSALQPGATGHTRFVTGATSSNPVLGIVVGLEFQGKITEVTSIVGVNAAKGTSSATAGVYTDNETSKDWAVVYIPTYVPLEYTATLNAAAESTTNSSGIGWFRIAAISASTTPGSGTLDETTILLFTDTTIASHQFWSNGALTTTSTTVTGHFGISA